MSAVSFTSKLIGALLLLVAVVAALRCAAGRHHWEIRIRGALAPAVPEFGGHTPWATLPPPDWKIGVELKFPGHRLVLQPDSGALLLTQQDRRSIVLARAITGVDRPVVDWQSSGTFELKAVVTDSQPPQAARLLYWHSKHAEIVRGHSFPIETEDRSVEPLTFALSPGLCLAQAPVMVAGVLEGQLARKKSLGERFSGHGVPGFLQVAAGESQQRLEMAFRLRSTDEELALPAAEKISSDFLSTTLATINGLSTPQLINKLVALEGSGEKVPGDTLHHLGKLFSQIVSARLAFFTRLGVVVPPAQAGATVQPAGEPSDGSEAEFPQD